MKGNHFVLPGGTLLPACEGPISSFSQEAKMHPLPPFPVHRTQQGREERADPAFPLRTAWLTL